MRVTIKILFYELRNPYLISRGLTYERLSHIARVSSIATTTREQLHNHRLLKFLANLPEVSLARKAPVQISNHPRLHDMNVLTHCTINLLSKAGEILAASEGEYGVEVREDELIGWLRHIWGSWERVRLRNLLSFWTSVNLQIDGRDY